MAKNMAGGLLLAIAPGGKKSKAPVDEMGGDDLMDQEGDEDEMHEGKLAAAEDALAAFKAGDAAALSEALTAHYEMCVSGKSKKSDDAY